MSQWYCHTVALVDDDNDLRHAMAQMLEINGLSVLALPSGEAALRSVDASFAGVVLSDVRMPGMDGLELQRRLHEIDPDLPVILVTGHGDVPMAVNALQHGAYDFLTKPFAPEQVVAITKRALQARAMHLELTKLRATSRPTWPLIGQTPVMQQLARTIEQVAGLDIDVSIEGETGTGKGLIAKTLHETSKRSRGAMIAIDCGALNDRNVERELFGVAPGHVSQSSQRWVGRFEQANNGTLFLDCIDALDGTLQQRLERVLETRTIVPLGRSRPEAVDVRIVSASKVALSDLVKAGQFSGPLYYRLNAVTLKIPPLRERRDDVPILFAAFLKRACELAGREVPKTSASVWRRLIHSDWPGNVRELMNYADQVALNLDGYDRPKPTTSVSSDTTKGLKDLVADYEASLIEDALRATRGNVSEALGYLNLPRKTFYDKVTRLGIDLGAFKKR